MKTESLFNRVLKSTFVFIAVIGLISFSSSATLAQNVDNEPQPVETNGTGAGYFDIKLELGTQSPWNKEIPIKVIFTPSQAGDRVFIGADTPYGLDVKYEFENNFTVAANTTYTKEIRVIPSTEGVYKVAVSITNWDYGQNATSTASIDINLDSNLTTIPQSPGYALASMIRYILLFGGLALLIAGILFGGYKAKPYIAIWFKPPE